MKTTHIPKQKRPEIEEIHSIVKRIKSGKGSYSSIAREYNVSDNAVRKWIRKSGIQPPIKQRGQTYFTCDNCGCQFVDDVSSDVSKRGDKKKWRFCSMKCRNIYMKENKGFLGYK